MLPRDRVRAVLKHLETDRVPVDLGGVHASMSPGALRNLMAYLEIDEEIVVLNPRIQVAQIPEFILKTLDIDFRWLTVRSMPPKAVEVDRHPGAVSDEWGLVYRVVENALHPQYIQFPLSSASTIEEIAEYQWPTTKTDFRLQGTRQKAQQYHDAGYAVAVSLGGSWERSWYMRGMEQMLMDLISNRNFASALLDKILEVQMEIYAPFLNEVGEYIDLASISSDIGTQQSLLVSPQIWREVIRPREQQLLDLLRKKTKAKIALHSCGAVKTLIPDFIEMGVEVLNPVQTQAAGMDPDVLKREFGKDLSFWGGIDTQWILPFGSEKDVEFEVKKKLQVFAMGGGYLCAPCQNIQPEVPGKNIYLLYHTAQRWGEYPLVIG